MGTTTTIYRMHTAKRNVKTFCTVCGKNLRRTISDYFTMNPFNRYSFEESVERRDNDLDRLALDLEICGTICRKCEGKA